MSLSATLDTLNQELFWLNQLIEYRFVQYFQQNIPIEEPTLPSLENDLCKYSEYVKRLSLDETQRLLIILALAPHLRPSIFDLFSTKNKVTDRPYTEFGGIKGEKYTGFIPTAETAAFILAGSALEKRVAISKALDDKSILMQENIIRLGESKANEPVWSGELIISEEFRVEITEGIEYKPRFTTDFPAELIETQLDWSDAVFEDSIQMEIHLIEQWLQNEQLIMSEWGLKKYLKKGYRALFYGPPGTGKSMAASLLGKSTKRKVYRVDLSNVISKYIGETEKNLARLFDVAENKEWILFFDEADALFSKRSNTSTSNDIFANQQVAFLLQRIEDFNGLTILASNFKDNMDEAFLRRFQSLVHFKKPGYAQRVKLWEKYFEGFDLVDVNLESIAEEFELTGGSIINILRFCAQLASRHKKMIISDLELKHAIHREVMKENI